MKSFRNHMEAALYDPRRGYYPSREAKRDFYTAPELHPAFAGVLAREILKRMERLEALGVPGPYFLVEMGSGSGELARQILSELNHTAPGWSSMGRYVLVERCRDLLLESLVALSPYSRQLLGYSRLEELLSCNGVFFSNELVDSFPVHLLEKRGDEVFEVYVGDEGEARLGRLSVPELKPSADRARGLAEGERHAVNREALRWLSVLSEKIQNGFLLTIDYGTRYPAGVANPPRTFYRHATGSDALTRPGQDITANVDFETLIQEGRGLGFALESYGSLGRFLMEGGVSDWLKPGSDAASFKERAQLKTLIHPEGMGEVFKVLVQSRLPHPS